MEKLFRENKISPLLKTPEKDFPAALLHKPPAGVEEGAGVEQAGVDEDWQPVVAGQGKI